MYTQCTNTVRIFGSSKAFELEVPFARGPLVWKEPPSAILVARTTWMIRHLIEDVYRDIQQSRMTSLEACFDEASTF